MIRSYTSACVLCWENETENRPTDSFCVEKKITLFHSCGGCHTHTLDVWDVACCRHQVLLACTKVEQLVELLIFNDFFAEESITEHDDRFIGPADFGEEFYLDHI